jgi:hypothetical protein
MALRKTELRRVETLCFGPTAAARKAQCNDALVQQSATIEQPASPGNPNGWSACKKFVTIKI